MHLVFLIIAIVCELVAVLIDFGIFDTDSPHTLGWVAAGLLAYFISLLPFDGRRRV